MSDTRLAERQHVVNVPVRPVRSPEGDEFTDLVVDVAMLGGLFTARGESLARLGGQSLARWVVLDAAEDGPSSVAQIARRRGIARQAIQRVADNLEREGLITYEPNPEHRRAHLVVPTDQGREALRVISVAQKQWADTAGAAIGSELLAAARQALADVRAALGRAEQSLPPELDLETSTTDDANFK